MSIAVICTGSELLKGVALNTDFAFLAGKLTEAGMPPVLEISCPDKRKELFAAIAEACRHADTVIISGGLGPTADDLTLDTVARFFGLALHEDPELRKKIAEMWTRRHLGKCPKMQYRQARVPENGRIMPNARGSAPGIEIEVLYDRKKRNIFLLPGPPREFEPMVTESLLPRLLAKSGEKFFTGGFFCFEGEFSALNTTTRAVAGFPVETACALLAGGTRIFISGHDRDAVGKAVEKARNAIGKNALPSGVFDPAAMVMEILENRGFTLGCAESCTGGLVANRFVSVPGASAVFNGGIVAYANEVKQNILGVPESILSAFGAVSAECAEAMVKGCRHVLKCDCAVSTTGIAGPDGGTAEKPLGLVYIAAAAGENSAVRELHLSGDRRAIRERTVEAALRLLWELLIQE